MLLAALGLVGIGVSAFLTGVEAFVIHAYCTWYLVQAGAALALGVATLRGVAMRDGPMPIRDASRRTRRQLHDKLFATQGGLDEPGPDRATQYITQLATQAGLDLARWQHDWQSAAVAATVTSDATAATELSLPQTPSIFINGTFYQGSLSLADLQSAVAAARG